MSSNDFVGSSFLNFATNWNNLRWKIKGDHITFLKSRRDETSKEAKSNFEIQFFGNRFLKNCRRPEFSKKEEFLSDDENVFLVSTPTTTSTTKTARRRRTTTRSYCWCLLHLHSFEFDQLFTFTDEPKKHWYGFTYNNDNNNDDNWSMTKAANPITKQSFSLEIVSSATALPVTVKFSVTRLSKIVPLLQKNQSLW